MVTKCLDPNVKSFLKETIICFQLMSMEENYGLLFCSLRVQSCYGMIWYFKLLPKSDKFNEILAWLSSHFFYRQENFIYTKYYVELLLCQGYYQLGHWVVNFYRRRRGTLQIISKNSRISLVVQLQDHYFKPFMSFHVILHGVSFLWPPTNILCNFFTVLFTTGAVNRSS